MYNIKIHFGKYLSTLRRQKGVSQQEVADDCGLERAYISRLERGLSEPSVTTLFKISDYFGITASEIVTFLDKNRRKSK